ncbi:MAG: metal ABC transporter permease, partial [Sulfurovum sp.]
LAALTVVVSIKVVGLILVIAMLTIPVYIAEKLSHSLFSMMFLSGLIATLFTLAGLWFSYTYDLTSGASIIIISAISLGLFLLLHKGK